MINNLSAMQGTQVQSLAQEDPLEEETYSTYSSIFAWEIQWTGEPGRLQFMGSQRVGHNLVINTLKHSNTLSQLNTHIFIYIHIYILQIYAYTHIYICVYKNMKLQIPSAYVV